MAEIKKGKKREYFAIDKAAKKAKRKAVTKSLRKRKVVESAELDFGRLRPRLPNKQSPTVWRRSTAADAYERAGLSVRPAFGLLRGPGARGSVLVGPPLPLRWRNKSVRLWQLLGGLAYGSLPSGSASIHRQCSASAALSTAQASRWRSR